jgi:hypothetical protein
VAKFGLLVGPPYQPHREEQNRSPDWEVDRDNAKLAHTSTVRGRERMPERCGRDVLPSHLVVRYAWACLLYGGGVAISRLS